MKWSKAGNCVAAVGALVAMATTVPVARAAAAAQAGQLDLSSGSCGISSITAKDPSTGGWYGGSHTGSAMAVQPDGKIVLAGDRALGRRLPDGSADYTFGDNGFAYAPWVSGTTIYISQVAVQADGRILVAGTRADSSTNANRTFYLARYLSTGAVDPSFATGAQPTPPVQSGGAGLALQPDGKVLVFGGGSVMRLLSSGALDPSFAQGGVATISDSGPVGMAVQPDGKVVVATQIVDYTANRYDFGILRLRPDGSADPTFGSGQRVTIDVGSDYAAAVAIDRSGRIIVAGTTLIDQTDKTVVIRRLADGGPDASFGHEGVAVAHLAPLYGDSVRGLMVDADGRPVVTAQVMSDPWSESPAIARFTAEGSLDSTFGDGGKTIVPLNGGPPPSGPAQTPDGGFVMASGYGGGSVMRFRGDRAGSADLVTAATCSKRVTVTPVGGLDYGIPEGRGTPRGYSVTNTGTAPVLVARVTILHPNNLAVLDDTCTGTPIAPGASCQILIARTGIGDGLGGTPFMTIWHNGEGGWLGTTFFSSPGGGVQPATAFGWNGLGQVGSGPPGGSNRPADVGLPDTVAVAAGWFHTLALRTDGTVWAWGWNGVGQLGDGTTVDRHTPVQVPGLADVASVAAGAHSSFAITRDGSVYAWGWNAVGQLGDGTTIDRRRPVRLTSLPPMAMVSGGAFHTLAVSADRRAWSWGWNGLGQLGDGTTTDHLTPQPIPGLEGVRQVAAGMLHSLSVSLGGAVSAWGWNGVGQLGDGTKLDHARPAPVLGLDGNVSVVAAGAHHGVAVRNGRLVAWGWNASGQLGDATVVDRTAPVDIAVPGDWLDVATVAGGAFHTLATVKNGTVWAWGWNGVGQLGLGTTESTAVPVQVGALQGPVGLSAGYAHTVVG